jgi:hypothetical protein
MPSSHLPGVRRFLHESRNAPGDHLVHFFDQVIDRDVKIGERPVIVRVAASSHRTMDGWKRERRPSAYDDFGRLAACCVFFPVDFPSI